MQFLTSIAALKLISIGRSTDGLEYQIDQRLIFKFSCRRRFLGRDYFIRQVTVNNLFFWLTPARPKHCGKILPPIVFL